jgi:uncharacterized phage protein (TIGR02220 family)
MSLIQQAKAYAFGVLSNETRAVIDKASVEEMIVKSFIAGSKQKTLKKALVAEVPPESVKRVIEHLNSVTGRKYRVPTGKVLKEMKARLIEEDVTVEGVFLMIERQWEVWANKTGSNGTPMRDYVCPSTLFRPGNFNNYYANKDLPVRERRSSLRNLPYSNEE